MSWRNNLIRWAQFNPEASNFYVIRPEWVFLIIAAVAGLFVAFLNPPFQSPDEEAHFFRAYQLSNGTLIAEKSQNQIGGCLPQCILDAWRPFLNIKKIEWATVHQLLKEPFVKTPGTFFDFKHTALYSPVAYGPALVGMWCGRAIGFSALGQLYASRITTLLGWLVVVFFAIRTIPIFKWVMVMIALMPMTVYLSASVSADGMTNAMAMLTTALILRSTLARESAVEPGEWIAITLACVLLALTKQIYFLIAFLAFMTPVKRFGGWKMKAMLCLGTIGAATAANLIWMLLVRNTVAVESWVNPHEQTVFILSHPFRYAAFLFENFFNYLSTYLIWFVGTLGCLNVNLPEWIWPTYITGLVAAAFVDKGCGRPLKWSERCLIIGICAASILLIMTSQYILYSPPAGKILFGVQGRYFIPLAVPGLLAFYNCKLKISEKTYSIIVTAYCITVLVVTCLKLFDRYYL